ncbi:GvpL/GvpF family gas vesicle protein [Streptomyces beigongshangae]|uniref:GvpL/GvpF family gas vesicle protein n=1 Tax=Streptomyces beigongshangae TaxID=2841597 RepID=UPI001C8514F4|nr:GvpL/GvpF family gas vesicle protein [Streptomyces sp. REN17]
MTEHTALYVYALLRHDGEAGTAGALAGVTGLDGRALRLLHAPGTSVAALVHDAAPTPFQGEDEQIRRWVAEQNQAVTTVWERTGSLLPMTFNVLVADESSTTASHDGSPDSSRHRDRGQTAEQRLTRWITERAPEITAQLAELAGRCELRVEITVDRTAVTAPDSPAYEEAHLAGRSAGMRRLLLKQREQQAKNLAGQLADTLHAEVRHDLLSVAEDLRDRGLPRQNPDETGVLSAALLVRTEDIDTVGGVLSELQARQPAVRIRFLGPWPPYSFTDDRHSVYEDA